MSPVQNASFCPFNLRMTVNTCVNVDTLSVELDMLDGSRMLRQLVRSVRGFSPYATVWQAVLTGGLEDPI